VYGRACPNTPWGYTLDAMSEQTTTLTIDGMSCSHCVAAVTQALSSLDGVTVREVAVGRAVVDVDASRVTPAQVAAAVDDAGFRLAPVPAAFGPSPQGA